MIVKEFYSKRDDGVNLYRTSSDKGLFIQKSGTNEVYEEAIDVEGTSYTYVETDIEIPKVEPIESEYDEGTNIQ